jgi:acetamidase/formamidase
MATETAAGLRRFSKERTTLFFDPRAEPIAELRPDERIVVETADSICGLAKAEAPRGLHIDEVVDRLGGACPVTGPFWVGGAVAGDALELELHRVEASPAQGVGWTGVFTGFGALQHESYSLASGPEPELRLVAYKDNIGRFPTERGDVEIPLRTFLGTVGVAPRRERRLTFSQSPEYLGDVDVPQLGAGATLVLPVNVDGALLGLGDAHAAQGDGEVSGAALEVEAEAELTVRVRAREEAQLLALPQINADSWIGSVAGYEGVSLADCARSAAKDLIGRMTRFHGFSETEAYELLSLVGRLQVGNMIDPFYSVMAWVERRYLERS